MRGAGIFGLSVAWAAVRRGARVRMIDPGGVAAGASGGLVGALAPHTPDNWNEKKAFQLAALLDQAAFWGDIDATSGLSSGYARLGRLQPLADARAVALAEQRAGQAERLWGGAADWQVIDAEDADGWAPVSPSGKLVLDTLTARLDPAAACASLAEALRLRGVDIVPDGPGEGATVWATGVAGLADLGAALSRPVGNGVKGQAALLAFDAGAVPQVFGDGLHIVPHASACVAVGSTSERDFDRAETTDARLDDILARAELLMPALHGARVVRRWAGVRPRARTRAPILGGWPGRPGHFVANGGFKIGFGIAPKVGEVIARLILEGDDAIPAGFHVEDAL